MAEKDEIIIRDKIKEIMDHDGEVRENEELIEIFRTAYARRDAGKPMREVALALDKALAGYITSHDYVPDSITDLHQEMMQMSDI
ncbi:MULTISPECIES: bacteriocin immunity protein [Lactobacillus]|uniref:Bacteriocin immunity protein n=1 Tax=Lactobacillus xujianguonis TaxID=2495899 RepID=A0A437SSU1_9LACO|nr:MULTISPECIES: bacteriocin immunity protein [Lactobacillus]RVU69965.1 bacteriocin immunity protein [Lactobacillus xujianguonis]RVU72351.1 bacteriocin immunity protein [Lactobacillus xujianguonis]